MKIALFDLDETLVRAECRNYALEVICQDISKKTKIPVKILSNSLIQIWHQEKDPRKKYDWDQHIKKLCSEVKVEFIYNYETSIKKNINKAKLFPDVLPLLKYLKKNKYKICIITNGLKKYQYPIMKKLGLLKYISKVYSPHQGFLKPDPRIFNNELKNKQVSFYADDQLYQGVFLARKIHTKSILIDRKFKAKNLNSYLRNKLSNELKERRFDVSLKHLTPDYIVNDLRKIIKILENESK
ncbi:MAG TPA: HAD family hydrolase [Candidatus Nanoarchaeia archaeon]|nr:HAD family hydrolase [Candidatus Nanoarchaeia archaeon]